jgi:hypothetical protein
MIDRHSITIRIAVAIRSVNYLGVTPNNPFTAQPQALSGSDTTTTIGVGSVIASDR